MITRFVAILIAVLALLAAVAAFVRGERKMRKLSHRIERLERLGPTQPPAHEAGPQEKPAPRKEMDPDMVRGLALRDCQQRIDGVAQELKLDGGLEMKVRDAFADEFSFYADGVVRAFENLQSRTSDSNPMTSPEFQKKLEEHILATDQKVAQVLTVSQRWVYEKWRAGMRKEFYELE
jgi:hypothetical protein